VTDILTWRSAAGDNSQAAAPGYRPRHGPFHSVDELRLVAGITPEIYARVAHALTVYSGRPDVDPQFATKDVLALSSAEAAQQTTDAGGQQPGTLPMATPLAGRAFTITVEIALQGIKFARVAVVELTGEPVSPYFVRDWR
jgi:general secretion pathway protein K